MRFWQVMIRGLVLCFSISFYFGQFASAVGAPAVQPVPTMDSVARIHWIGKNRISTNGAGELLRLWAMPESLKLQEQTLDKLSAAPWRLLRGESNPASTNLMRPLLRDLVDEEFYLQLRAPSGSADQPGELVLAIRLADSRARLWQTNVAAALESLTSLQLAESSPGRRVLRKHHVPNLIEFAHAGQWILLGAAEGHNALLDESIARIKSGNPPFVSRSTNSWLEADVDLPRIAPAMGHRWRFPPNFPAISLTLAGEGNAVHIYGELHFPKMLSLEIQPWNVPTNLIDGELTSFTAVRGWTPDFLSRFWDHFETNSAPTQFYLWSVEGAPMETYLAAPLVDASNAVSHLSDLVLQHTASWFHTNDFIAFQKSKKFNGLEWRGIPYISPMLKAVDAPNGGFLLGGFFPPVPLSHSSPDSMLIGLRFDTNLVYYSSELTGTRINQLTYLSQLLRLVMGKPQFPEQSPAMSLLKALSQTRGQSRTEITCAGPRRFLFDRSGDTPFTAIEWQFLADWFNSPQFPALDLSFLDAH